MNLTTVQTKSLVVGNDGLTSATLTFDAPLTPGNAVLIFAVGGKVSGTGSPAVSIADIAGNLYSQKTSFGPGGSPGAGIKCFSAFVRGTSQALTITKVAASYLTIYAMEVSPPGTNQMWDFDAGEQASFDPNDNTNSPVSDPVALEDPDVPVPIFGLASWATTISETTCTPQAPATSLFSYLPTDGTTMALAIGYRDSYADQDTMGFDLSASATLVRGGAIPLIPITLAMPQASGEIYPTPKARYDSRDQGGIPIENAITSLAEHSGGAAATVTNGIISDVQGINGHRCVSISSGNITIPWSGPLGAIGMVVRLPAATSPPPADGTVYLGFDDANHGSSGAGSIAIASAGVSAQLATDAGGSDGTAADATGSTAINGAVTVFNVDAGAKTATLNVNGFEYTASFTGTPTNPTSISIFSAFASGTAGTGDGNFYQICLYDRPLSSAERESLSYQLAAHPYGPPVSKRWLMEGGDNNTNQLAVQESDGGTDFQSSGRYISYSAKKGQTRDFALEGYDVATSTIYFTHTENNFATVGTKFGRAKTKGDWRRWIQAASVDCSGVTTINAGTASPWGPRATPHGMPTLGVPTHYSFTESNSANVYVAPIASGWPAAPVLGTCTKMAGIIQDQVLICLPGDPGNPIADNYRAYGGEGYQDASALTGPYGSRTSFSGASGFQAEYSERQIMDDGTKRFITGGTDGFAYYETTDNGATFLPTRKHLTNILSPISPTQSDIIDRAKLPGTLRWSRPSSSLSIGLGIQL